MTLKAPGCQHRHCHSDWIDAILEDGWGGCDKVNAWLSGLTMAARWPDLLTRLDGVLEEGPQPMMKIGPGNQGAFDTLDLAITRAAENQEPGDCHKPGAISKAWRNAGH